MKAIHIWIAVMILLCAVAFVLLIGMSSCAAKADEPLPEAETDAASQETLPDTGATDTASEGDEPATGEAEEPTETASERATEKATETASETDTEKATETEPPLPKNRMKYADNPDGTCRLVSVGECRDACIVIPETVDGKKVTTISASAFYGCETVTAIQIPATVQKIGDLAFAGCPNLTYIAVSEGNSAYRDEGGVLYSADGSTLIAYPASRGGTSVYIGKQVKRVSAMAFYGCKYLSVVYYAGTAAEWEQIVIGSGNYSLIVAAVSTASPSPNK